MSGIISFHFDDGHTSHYTEAFPLFREAGVVGCLALPAKPTCGITTAQALEMQEAGWEVLSHSINHIPMRSPLPEDQAQEEICESHRLLSEKGFVVKQFVTPCSQCHPSMRSHLAKTYEAAFTQYTDSRKLTAEELVIERPVNRFLLHRACMAGKTEVELFALVDYVAANNRWLVFYDHDLNAGENITTERLRALLAYCKKAGVAVLTSSQALAQEKCVTKIIQEGFDGKRCFVHTRCAAAGENILMTSQLLNVQGSDDFDCLNVSCSHDGGKTFTALTPDKAFLPWMHDGIRTVASDMTPYFHKKTGRFLVTGHTVDYFEGANVPVPNNVRRSMIPYAVFDWEKKCFGPMKTVEMPAGETYVDCGSGCSQICELDNGELLIPVYYREKGEGASVGSKGTVFRCSFDGETIRILEIGNALTLEKSVRGMAELSILSFGGRYYLTIRDDDYGYISQSNDGLHFTTPQVWRFDDGEIVPTYNTQSHWFTLGDKAYLVYTRKNGKNDHVFRHRAPLYAAEFLPETLSLKRESEFVVVPERGARLGNFGCFAYQDHAMVVVSEWMQPTSCVAYGSDNAIWLSEVRKG